MEKIKLIYGSDTGNTYHVINTYIIPELENYNYDYDLIEIRDITPNDWIDNTHFILGIPTWYDGELQSDWEEYFEEFKQVDFKNKKVALFGLGDQIGYDEWFCDGIGILAEVIEKNGGTVIGKILKDDTYDFETMPKALIDDNTFWGLPLDWDNQEELTEERCINWFKQLEEEWNKQ
tara:strand:+ start:696 stop:1226 length:531 start_codon:yes stop_codon:yes gene_type:complete